MIDTDIRHLSDGAVTKDRKIRTLIMAGYDLYKDDKGISQLNEQVIEPQHNKITVGGILHILKLLFGVDSNLDIKTLNELLGIATSGIKDQNSKRLVFAFDVGLGGCGASYADEKEVLDQENIVKNIIPFRIVDSEEELGDMKNNYWFKKTIDGGKIAYYLKTFEGTPEIHTLWKDAIDDDADGNPVVGNPSESTRTEGMESFAEIILRISAQDLREYFELYEPSGAKYARFNTIGLCVGQKGTINGDGEDVGETEILDAIQFSILNFSNEMLHFEKDLSIIYRVYIS